MAHAAPCCDELIMAHAVPCWDTRHCLAHRFASGASCSVGLATSVRHKLNSLNQSICSCLAGSSDLKKTASNALPRESTSAHSLPLPATCDMRSCSLWRAACSARDCRTLATGCFRERHLCEAATTPALSQLWRKEIQPAWHTSPRCWGWASRKTTCARASKTTVAAHPAPAGS